MAALAWRRQGSQPYDSGRAGDGGASQPWLQRLANWPSDGTSSPELKRLAGGILMPHRHLGFSAMGVPAQDLATGRAAPGWTGRSCWVCLRRRPCATCIMTTSLIITSLATCSDGSAGGCGRDGRAVVTLEPSTVAPAAGLRARRIGSGTGSCRLTVTASRPHNTPAQPLRSPHQLQQTQHRAAAGPVGELDVKMQLVRALQFVSLTHSPL